jgi:hypothetical protein
MRFFVHGIVGGGIVQGGRRGSGARNNMLRASASWLHVWATWIETVRHIAHGSGVESMGPCWRD